MFFKYPPNLVIVLNKFPILFDAKAIFVTGETPVPMLITHPMESSIG